MKILNIHNSDNQKDGSIAYQFILVIEFLLLKYSGL